MRVRSLLSATAFAALAASAMPACLADLPPALQCPPRAVHQGDCSSAIPDPASAGCTATDPHAVACYAGARDSCACGASECPASAATCFPAGDCPAAVTDLVGPNVTCVPIPPEALQVGADGCACGCVACASACDGMGPVVSARLPPGSQTVPAMLVSQLHRLLPSSGRLGVYIRVRGITSMGVGVGGGGQGTNTFGKLIQGVSTTELSDFVAYESGSGPNASPVWTTADGAPSTLAIVLLQGPTMAEIDCVLPFVVPP